MSEQQVNKTQTQREIFVNGYVYVGIDPTVLIASAPNLTSISLFTYGITRGGGLVRLDDRSVIEIVRPYNVGGLMVVNAMDERGTFNSNLASYIFQDRQASERLLNEILSNIREKGLVGVDFDFEYIFPQDREAYAAFVLRARQMLEPQGYIVSVALAPKTSSQQAGTLYGSHDYNLLGNAANYVFLMTYEWGYTYGPPMAVSPLDQVRQVIQYAVSEIQPSKILLGMPNYAYDWTLPFMQGRSQAENISLIEAEARAERYGAVIQFDPNAQTAYYNYVDSQNRQHQVWFDNAESIAAKLSLVNEYGLGGVTYWNLIEYNPVNWEILNSMFNVRKLPNR